jgi:hypothetical protein
MFLVSGHGFSLVCISMENGTLVRNIDIVNNRDNENELKDYYDPEKGPQLE